jgi:sec-independent protein translocase protein TatC
MLRMRRDLNPNREMPFTEHLLELRTHLIHAIRYLVVGMAICAWKYNAIMEFMIHPIKVAFDAAGIPTKFLYTHLVDPMFFSLQVVLSGGLVLALPFILWEIWRFVAPGLYPAERKYVKPLLPCSLLLCLAGFALVYHAMPIAFRFLLTFIPADRQQFELRQEPPRYFLLVAQMMLSAAVTFQAPIIFFLLGQLGLVTSRAMLVYWRHAVLACFTLAAFITPTIDPFTMSTVAIPLCGLYAASVGLVWGIEVKRRRDAARAASQPPPPAPPSSEPPALPPPPPETGPDEPPAAPPPVEPPPPPPEPAPVTRAMLGPLAVPSPPLPPLPEPPAPPVEPAPEPGAPAADAQEPEDEALFDPGL